MTDERLRWTSHQNADLFLRGMRVSTEGSGKATSLNLGVAMMFLFFAFDAGCDDTWWSRHFGLRNDSAEPFRECILKNTLPDKESGREKILVTQRDKAWIAFKKENFTSITGYATKYSWFMKPTPRIKRLSTFYFQRCLELRLLFLTISHKWHLHEVLLESELVKWRGTKEWLCEEVKQTAVEIRSCY